MYASTHPYTTDDNTVKRLYRWFNIVYDNNTRIISSFSLNDKKVAMARRTSGFYAIATLGMDLTAIRPSISLQPVAARSLAACPVAL